MKHISAEILSRIMVRALVRRGVAVEHARWAAEALTEASLRGIDTHGVVLFPVYLQELDGGRARSRPEVTWVVNSGAMRVLDAGGALGLVAGHVATDETIRLAKEHGVGAVAVRNSNHYGAASNYTLAMARCDLVGMSFSNSDALVAPFNGTRPLFGTNPLSLAARGNDDEILCIDMATSQSSFSRIKQRRERGEPLERGWAMTADGQDACDSEGEIAALSPLGGYKGQCLSMLVELLCAFLAGSRCDHLLSHLYEPPYDTPREVAHLFLAFDIEALDVVGRFRARLSHWMAAVRTQAGGHGAPVLVPGDLEAASARARRTHGIPMSSELLQAFRRIDREDASGQREGL